MKMTIGAKIKLRKIENNESSDIKERRKKETYLIKSRRSGGFRNGAVV